MRAHLAPEKYVVIHDGFDLMAWKDFMQEDEYQNVVLDTHQYLMMAEMDGCPQTVEGYVEYVQTKYAKINGMEGTAQESFSPEQKKEIYQAVASAQLDAWKKGSGYFYWSYKLLVDTVNEPGWIGWDSWDLGRCVDFGWFPPNR